MVHVVKGWTQSVGFIVIIIRGNYFSKVAILIILY